MYERTRHSRTPKRDVPLRLWIIGGVALLILLAVPLFFAGRSQYRFRGFVKDMMSSTLYAREHGGVTCTLEGEDLPLTSNQVSGIYQTLTVAGGGKTRKELPEAEELVIDFGDGSSLRLWGTKIVEPNEKKLVNGVVVSYVDQEGKTFSYDTDQIDLRAFSAHLPGEAEPWIQEGTG